MKEYSKVLELEPHHQLQINVIARTLINLEQDLKRMERKDFVFFSTI